MCRLRGLQSFGGRRPVLDQTLGSGSTALGTQFRAAFATIAVTPAATAAAFAGLAATFTACGVRRGFDIAAAGAFGCVAGDRPMHRFARRCAGLDAVCASGRFVAVTTTPTATAVAAANALTFALRFTALGRVGSGQRVHKGFS